MTQALNSITADLRDYPRQRFSAPVEVQFRQPVTGDYGGNLTCAVCYDISRSGMRIYSSVPLEGKEIRIRFKPLKNIEVIRVARIVRCQTQENHILQYGLVFESLLPESLLTELAEESQKLSVDPEFLFS